MTLFIKSKECKIFFEHLKSRNRLSCNSEFNGNKKNYYRSEDKKDKIIYIMIIRKSLQFDVSLMDIVPNIEIPNL